MVRSARTGQHTECTDGVRDHTGIARRVRRKTTPSQSDLLPFRVNTSMTLQLLDAPLRSLLASPPHHLSSSVPVFLVQFVFCRSVRSTDFACVPQSVPAPPSSVLNVVRLWLGSSLSWPRSLASRRCPSSATVGLSYIALHGWTRDVETNADAVKQTTTEVVATSSGHLIAWERRMHVKCTCTNITQQTPTHERKGQ
jgi:hypothetical protein